MKSAQAIWKSAIPILKEGISEITYNTWFSKLKPIGIDNNVFRIMASSAVIENVISHMYIDNIKKAIFLVSQQEYEIEITLKDSIEKEEKVVYNPPIESNNDFTDEDSMPFNPKFTFDEFVVGPNNEFSYGCSLGVVNMPAVNNNPLLIYGGTGLGKTHLMQAIGIELKKRRPDWKVLYITSEKFTTDLVESLHKKTNMSFREKYRKVDVLLIDDIQFFAGKERTQEEFFHTFNELYNCGKQIILTSDRPPKDIRPLSERIKSRIEAGLLADIQPPDYETRLAILRKKLDSPEFDSELPDEVIDLIATHIKSNIRELEGAVKKLVAYKEISHKDIDAQIACNVLKDIMSSVHTNQIDAKRIISEVERYFNLNNDAILSKKRTKNIVFARQLAMYILRQLTDYSMPKIGKEFNRDYSTVHSSITKIQNEIETNLSALNAFNELVEKIQNC